MPRLNPQIAHIHNMLTQEQREKIIELCKQGKPTTHIAQELNVSRGTIDNIRKELGDIEPKEPEEKTSKFKINENSKNKLLGLSALCGNSPEEQFDELVELGLFIRENKLEFMEFIPYLRSKVQTVLLTCPECDCMIGLWSTGQNHVCQIPEAVDEHE